MTTIGLIGLGNMGMPMAVNLLRGGHQVVGYRRGDAADFRAIGGEVAASPREVAERSRIMICCIPDEPALEEVISGPQGIAKADCSGRIVAELSTLSTDAKARQADAVASCGGILLDGAISGLPPMVAARKAIFLLSGNEAAYRTVEPVLSILTEKLFYMGEFGAALKAKLCANMLVAANIAAVAETLAFGAKLGLDQMRLIEALKDGAGTSLQFMARAQRMATGDWHKVLGSNQMLAKDIHLIEEAGLSVGCPLPILSNAARIYERAIEAGYGNLDSASVYAVFANAAGLTVPGEEKEQ
jgi:L-threonate 2-dehydrogenase